MFLQLDNLTVGKIKIKLIIKVRKSHSEIIRIIMTENIKLT